MRFTILLKTLCIAFSVIFAAAGLGFTVSGTSEVIGMSVSSDFLVCEQSALSAFNKTPKGSGDFADIETLKDWEFTARRPRCRFVR